MWVRTREPGLSSDTRRDDKPRPRPAPQSQSERDAVNPNPCWITTAQNPLGLSVDWLRFFSMNSDRDDKRETADPDEAMRLLELELMQQRAARGKAGTPYRGLKIVSILFLFFMVAGALLAFFYLFAAGGLDDLRARNAAQPSATPKTTSSRP